MNVGADLLEKVPWRLRSTSGGSRRVGQVACSDIATEGYQHVDGAVRMGARVAEQILER